MAAHRLRLRDFHAGQRPRGRAERLVAFEAELHDLPAGDGLRVDDAQFGLRVGARGRVVDVAHEVVAHARGVDARDGVAARDGEQQFAQGRFADIELDLGVDRLLRLAEVVGGDLGDGELGQDLVGLDAQREIRAGEAIGETLRALGAKERLGGVGLGKLLGRDLGEALGLGNLEADRALIDDAHVARETRRRAPRAAIAARRWSAGRRQSASGCGPEARIDSSAPG